MSQVNEETAVSVETSGSPRPAQERRVSPDERYRSGWCCDYDFDEGTYRTTDCIGRTRNADVVEAAAYKRGLFKAIEIIKGVRLSDGDEERPAWPAIREAIKSIEAEI